MLQIPFFFYNFLQLIHIGCMTAAVINTVTLDTSYHFIQCLFLIPLFIQCYDLFIKKPCYK